VVLFRPPDAITRVQRASLRPAGATPPPGTVSLAMGEPDFPTPEPIVAAACRALRDGHTHYGDLNGDPELRDVIAHEATELSGRAHTERNVAVTHGGSAAITATILATVDSGDRVVIPEPTYSLYPDAVRLAGGEPVLVPTTPDHRLDLDALAGAVRGARMVVLCNPVNPTGSVFGSEELHALADLLLEPTSSCSPTKPMPRSSTTVRRSSPRCPSKRFANASSTARRCRRPTP
jgi:aspartate aminotransferase